MQNHSLRSRLVGAAAAVLMLATLLPARAAFSQRDVLIKSNGSGAAVYYLANDGKRYVFPNQKTYVTWFTNFSSVVTVSDADLISFPLGGNVTYRPGIRLVKITTDPRVYAVDANGTLRWVSTEAVARALYGNDWNTKVDDVPDAFFVNYRIGSVISEVAHYNPHAAAATATTINADRGMSTTSGAVRANTSVNAPAHSGGSGSGSGSGSCSADVWVCGEWNSCTSNGTQTRDCQMTTNCSNVSSTRPEESRSCTYTAPSGNGTVTVQDNSDEGSVVGDTEAVLAKFRLSAQHEDLTMTRGSFSVADAVAVAEMRLYDGNTAVSNWADVDGNGNVSFSGVTFNVPRNTSKDLSVRGRLNEVGPNAAPTGSNARVIMRTTSGSYRFEMRSTSSSGNTVITSIPGGDKVGNDKFVRKTLITFVNQNLPTGSLVAGDVVAGRIRITADDAGDAAIKALTVRVSKSTGFTVAVTGSASQTTVREQGGSSNIAGSSTADGCNSGSGSCTIRVLFDEELAIAAGDSKTIDIRLNISGTINGSLQTSLEGDSDDVYNGKLTNGSDDDQVRVDGSNVNFAWTDYSDVPHDYDVGSSSDDWISGAYLTGLPNDVQVLND